MKVNDAALKVYTIGQMQTVQTQPAAETQPINHLARSRFADQLSVEEKRFITTNFTAETTTVGESEGKGRFIDIVA
ncbi:MAG: hypothetical protein ABIJ61_11445 [bacterium]